MAFEDCHPGLVSDYSAIKNAVTASHELFHLFQFDYTSNLAQTFEPDETYFREGSAAEMGFQASDFQSLSRG